MLVAIDNLARINEAYGFDVADEAIGAVAKRLRAKMRGGDQLGRFSGNKFGVILNNCTPDDMEKAAERLVAGVRDDVVRTGAGPVAVTVTDRRRHRAAPRRERAGNPGARAGDARPRQGQAAAARSRSIARTSSARRCGARTCAPPTRSSTALNERRILLAFEPVVETATRQPAFYECLMRIRRADGSLVPAQRGDPGRRAARAWCACSITACWNCWSARWSAVPDLNASVNVSPASTTDPDWWSTLGALLRANSGVAERLTVEITEIGGDPRHRRHPRLRRAREGSRLQDRDRRFRLRLHVVPQPAQARRRHPQDRRRLRAEPDAHRTTTAPSCRRWSISPSGSGSRPSPNGCRTRPSAKLLAEWGCDYLQGALIGLASVERPWGDAGAGRPAQDHARPESAVERELSICPCRRCGRGASASRRSGA